MDEMMNRMIEQMGKLTDALVMMSEKLDALKLPASALPLVEEAMAEAAKAAAPKKKAKKEEVKVEGNNPLFKGGFAVVDAPVSVAEVAKEIVEISAATAEAIATVALSSDDVRQAIKEVMDKKGTGVAKEIINGIGNAPNVSAIPAEKYEAVINACMEAIK